MNNVEERPKYRKELSDPKVQADYRVAVQALIRSGRVQMAHNEGNFNPVRNKRTKIGY